jgi:formaldehyde-activating enzyme involved in methanogenesis
MQEQPPPVRIGESHVGEGGEAAHINTALGDHRGPVGTAAGHAPANPFFSLE